MREAQRWCIYENIGATSPTSFEQLIFLKLLSHHNTQLWHFVSFGKFCPWFPTRAEFYCTTFLNSSSLEEYIALHFELPSYESIDKWIAEMNLSQVHADDKLFWYLAVHKGDWLEGLAVKLSDAAHIDFIIFLPRQSVMISVTAKLVTTFNTNKMREIFYSNIAQSLPTNLYQTNRPTTGSGLNDGFFFPISMAMFTNLLSCL